MINTAKLQALSTSHRMLKFLALLVWLTGGVMLLRKASKLLFEAHASDTLSSWVWIAIGFGIALGSLKAHFFFKKACKKNLVRIDSIKTPRLWQFFRPGFFFALALMITAGATLSRLAHGNYPFLLSVAALDVSIATGLLISSRVFLEEKALTKL